MRVGVVVQTGLGSLGPLGETLQVEGLEVRGKREDCAGPCPEFAGKKGGGSGTYPGFYVPQPGAPQPGTPTPRILRPAPANSSDLPLPASAESPTRVDVGRGAAQSSRHWLGSRSSRAAAVTLRLGLGALEEAGVC